MNQLKTLASFSSAAVGDWSTLIERLDTSAVFDSIPSPAFKVIRETEELLCSGAAMKSTSSDLPTVSNDQTSERERVIALQPTPSPRTRFRSLQAWQGVVLRVSERIFEARLFDMSTPGVEEIADFEINEVFDDDRSFIEAGAIFYWDVGYLYTPSGTRKASEIRFRRLPAWTAEELKKSAAEATRLVESLVLT